MTKETLRHRIIDGLRDMCYIWAKEMRSTITDEGVLIFFILVPLLYPLLYSWIYTNEVVREVPVAVVDLSHSSQSRQFIRMFDATPDAKIAYHCNNLAEAERLVERQVVKGILYFPDDFATQLLRSEQTHVGVYCDMSLMLTYKAIYQSAQGVAGRMGSGIQIAKSGSTTKRDAEITAAPLHVSEVQMFNSTGGYGNAIIPGVLMLIIQQTLLLGIGLSAGTARENNRYQDLVPISHHYNGIFRIVLGKSLCYLMIYSVLAAYLALAVPRLFGYTSISQPSALLGMMVPYLLACIFFGMSISCLVRYRENVMLLVVFMSVPLLFLSGVSWPESNIPGLWKGISLLFPSTFGVRAFIRVNTMGAALGNIQPEYIAMWVQALAYFFLTCIVYQHQLNQTRRHAREHIRQLKQRIDAALEEKKD
ncbi:MAG: ABC transporter permease [Prevotella sp.]|nr:ABC transporter permease [Prevotella sp.]